MSTPMTPTTEQELADIVRQAHGAGRPLRIRGGGTRQISGAAPDTDGLLDVSGMSGISLYDPGALTIVAAAGTPLDSISKALAAENQRLAFEPMDHRPLLGTNGVPTIGGVVAANISGPRRVSAGACRDSLIGVRFVDGQGQAIKNGGRVMKNVTGYDLVKLMAGSCGTLGVLSEVAFKVLPATDESAVLTIPGLSDAVAITVMADALRTPFEVSGAAHLPAGKDGVPLTMIRIEGFAAAVEERAAKLKTHLSHHGTVEIERDPVRNAESWASVRDVTPFGGRDGDVWRLSTKASDAPAIVARLGTCEVIYDWGGGRVWVLVSAGTDLRANLGPFQGHATIVRASDSTRRRLGVFHPEAAPIAALSERLRSRFDPRGILNPGLMQPVNEPVA